MKKLNLLTPKVETELINFAQNLVRIKSVTGDEEKIIAFIEKKMKEIGYDEIIVDSMGNVVGKIGNGKNASMLDSHIDTVDVKDEREWNVPPFSGKIVDGKLWGRGSVDMKSGAAASIYAGAVAKNAGLDSDTAVYVSCTVMEEDCDGENLKHVLRNSI